MRRRPLLAQALLAALLPRPGVAQVPALQAGPLVFPRDHGAHPGARTEWWYVTGELDEGSGPGDGFQVTFFRSRTGVGEHPSRFAARQLLFAHAALSDLGAGRLLHDQRIARAGFGIAEAAEDDTRVTLRDWQLRREPRDGGARYHARATAASGEFAFELDFDTTQPLLLQGDAGWSRKGPEVQQASRYYSQPQLRVSGRLQRAGRWREVRGRAWLDHEWSETLMHPQAVGWDWIGMNLDDGSALTAFRLRTRDGGSVWSGGSFRRPGEAARVFEGVDAVRFEPGRRWTSPATNTAYPVDWRVATPAGRWRVRALLDAQELDSRSSTGSVYWEGLSELIDEASGQRVGRGYLEMTGYAGVLRL
jgi:predicted secreted hydrolase